MNVYFPKNIFTELILNVLPEELKSGTSFLPSSLIKQNILKDENSVGLIPTFDLIQNKDLAVSKSFGISFEGSLCNSYFYFQSGEKILNEINLLGDISSNEIIGGKIAIKELYATEVNFQLLTNEQNNAGKNLLIVGSNNFENDRLLEGVSFSEEIMEVLSLPYVNYIMASSNRSNIENFHNSINGIQSKIYSNVENDNFGGNISESLRGYIKDNISSFICNLDEQDIDGINQLLRLSYFHQIVSDIIEVNFV